MIGISPLSSKEYRRDFDCFTREPCNVSIIAFRDPDFIKVHDLDVGGDEWWTSVGVVAGEAKLFLRPIP